MIIRFAAPKDGQSKHGTSFKGLALYLMHDPDKAETAERVAWTHTLNLAHDDIPSAVHEMLWTTRAADQLKREAGIRRGGRTLESPVKHFSLNWHPSDQPSPEEMIEAVKDFLEHMGWEDRQAVLIAHNDMTYSHVHVMLNAVSPKDGRSIDTAYEKARASNWALSYERSESRIHCTQRLKPFSEREPAPTRDVWLKMKAAEEEFDHAEAERFFRTPDYFDRSDPDIRKAKEWSLLKSHQRAERQDFFVEGKQAFRAMRNQIFREVRTEYREEWKGYFDHQRQGMDADSLAEMKADIAGRQKSDLEARRDESCNSLREQRDAEYRQLLDRQKEERAELRDWQSQGLASTRLLDAVHGEPTGFEANGSGEYPGERVNALFGSAASETCNPRSGREHVAEDVKEPENFAASGNEHHRVNDGASAAAGVGLGVLGAIAELSERLFDGFFGGGPAPKPVEKPPVREAEESVPKLSLPRQTELQIRAQEAEAADAEKLHAWWQERRRSRGHDRD